MTARWGRTQPSLGRHTEPQHSPFQSEFLLNEAAIPMATFRALWFNLAQPRPYRPAPPTGLRAPQTGEPVVEEAGKLVTTIAAPSAE